MLPGVSTHRHAGGPPSRDRAYAADRGQVPPVPPKASWDPLPLSMLGADKAKHPTDLTHLTKFSHFRREMSGYDGTSPAPSFTEITL